jgi:hypothetical protein
MKRTFITLFALFACCAAAFGQDSPPPGIWTSKEISEERANPLWVFKITPMGADSVNLRLMPESAIFDDGVDKGIDLNNLQALKLPLTDGKLRFGISKLQRGHNPKILQVSLHENLASTAEYMADLESRLRGRLRPKSVVTTNLFDFDLTAGNPPALDGDWKWQSVQVQYDNTLKELADMRSRLSFEWSDFPQPHPYAKELKVARDLQTAGITVASIGGAMTLFGGGLAVGMIAIAKYGTHEAPLPPHGQKIINGIAIAGLPLLATGIGLYIGGRTRENRIHRRVEDEQHHFRFNMSIGVGTLAVSYNF